MFEASKLEYCLFFLGIGLIFLLCFGIVCQALTLSTYVTPADKDRYKARLLAPSSDDLAILEKSVVGLTVLGVALPDPEVRSVYCSLKIRYRQFMSFLLLVIVTPLKGTFIGIACDLAIQNQAKKEMIFNH